MKILINALGIVDSGGLSVFNKLLCECSVDSINSYFIICNEGEFTNPLKKKYSNFSRMELNFIANKGIFHRLYYENIIFRRIIKRKNIRLIYNFSGTAQPFIKTPQLIKIQNLLFFSKAVDSAYTKHKKYILWIKQILFKRLILRMMLQRSKYIEIQSSHVKRHLSNFINLRDKRVYVKSDIDVSHERFFKPRKYNFSEKIHFLYIVGPHFEFTHKNFIVFSNAMLALNREGVDFEINITLTYDQVNNFKPWNPLLNQKTNFLGYISDQQKMKVLFCDNAILTSTSIIETLGLHVIEGIRNGVITIAPSEGYVKEVYGKNMVKYDTFNSASLLDAIVSVINDKGSHSEKILSLQGNLRRSEMSKFSSILDIFDEVANVQK